MSALKSFFQWLAGQLRYELRISYGDHEYFSISDKQARAVTAHRDKLAPTIEQIRYVLESMPAQTEVARRNRFLIAFTFVTGARDGAAASFKLKHIDVVAGKIDQDARE